MKTQEATASVKKAIKWLTGSSRFQAKEHPLTFFLTSADSLLTNTDIKLLCSLIKKGNDVCISSGQAELQISITKQPKQQII